MCNTQISNDISNNKESGINKMHSNTSKLLNFGDKMEMSSYTRVVCAMPNKNLI